jgi:hypothetical protein
LAEELAAGDGGVLKIGEHGDGGFWKARNRSITPRWNFSFQRMTGLRAGDGDGLLGK